VSDPAEFPPPAIFDTPRLLIATDAGYYPIVRLATKSQRYSQVNAPVLVLFGAGDSFPFKPRPSTILVSGMPAGVIACVPSLDEFGVASRLASTAGLPGCYDGPVTELGELWLQSLDAAMLAQVQIIVSGADETVSAAEELGRRMNVPVGVLPTQEPSP
jgi:dihydroorotate dehydrogenase electron transfer subunit